jgi:hypothetical protein
MLFTREEVEYLAASDPYRAGSLSVIGKAKAALAAQQGTLDREAVSAPWSAQEYPGGWRVTAKRGTILEPPLYEAQAKLMAAAPELAEVAEALDRAEDHNGDFDLDAIGELLTASKAALRKAGRLK